MKRKLCLLAATLCCLYVAHDAAEAMNKPLRLAVAGLKHGHAPMILGRTDRGDVRVVGIYEPRREVFDRYAKRYELSSSLYFADLGRMLDEVKPEAVAAFGTTFDHLAVVRACAPRGIHVMVEKPLAVSLQHAEEIEALAKKHRIHVLTNYETTWYASNHAVYNLAHGERALGPIRKMVIHDGHPGPQEIKVPSEFLEWLIDPVLNGGGALPDFGCYGANLATWLMKGEQPLAVTAVTQQIKPHLYPKVEDEATIILRYRDAQAIIQASWNWPINRKDIEVYGRDGYAHAADARNVRSRKAGDAEERAVVLERRQSPFDDPFAYLAAVVRGEAKIADADLSALANNMTVIRILDAAKQSAATGRTVALVPRSADRSGAEGASKTQH
ncbi:MAG TPA: Gfo/Idh/MocA family oxidoreductase [Pyrinomonadaceae bacterium]|nr:Gfo/Idh/MocA family oxidoreductase [Pyrinomonadaceae bacterium]